MSETPSPSMSFEAFVLSIGTASLVALGEIDNPITKKKEKDLPSARHHIDILEILLQKTRGNLNTQENKLLEDILYETRMKYVSMTSKK